MIKHLKATLNEGNREIESGRNIERGERLRRTRKRQSVKKERLDVEIEREGEREKRATERWEGERESGGQGSINSDIPCY